MYALLSLNFCCRAVSKNKAHRPSTSKLSETSLKYLVFGYHPITFEIKFLEIESKDYCTY